MTTTNYLKNTILPLSGLSSVNITNLIGQLSPMHAVIYGSSILYAYKQTLQLGTSPLGDIDFAINDETIFNSMVEFLSTELPVGYQKFELTKTLIFNQDGIVYTGELNLGFTLDKSINYVLEETSVPSGVNAMGTFMLSKTNDSSATNNVNRPYINFKKQVSFYLNESLTIQLIYYDVATSISDYIHDNGDFTVASGTYDGATLTINTTDVDSGITIYRDVILSTDIGRKLDWMLYRLDKYIKRGFTIYFANQQQIDTWTNNFWFTKTNDYAQFQCPFQLAPSNTTIVETTTIATIAPTTTSFVNGGTLTGGGGTGGGGGTLTGGGGDPLGTGGGGGGSIIVPPAIVETTTTTTTMPSTTMPSTTMPSTTMPSTTIPSTTTTTAAPTISSIINSIDSSKISLNGGNVINISSNDLTSQSNNELHQLLDVNVSSSLLMETTLRKEVVQNILLNVVAQNSEITNAATIYISKNLFPQSKQIQNIRQTQFLVVSASTANNLNAIKTSTINIDTGTEGGINLDTTGYYVYMDTTGDIMTFNKDSMPFLTVEKLEVDYSVSIYATDGTRSTFIQSVGIYNIDNFVYTLGTVALTANVCFPAGTPIQTDQGLIPIDQLQPKIHTIRGKPIVAITKTVTEEKYLVCLEKDALGKNVPNQKTKISANHEIFYKGKMWKAKYLVDASNEKVRKIKYKGESIYNVLLAEHDKMVVNNLICETLDPKSVIAQIYTKLNYEDCDIVTKIEIGNRLQKYYKNRKN